MHKIKNILIIGQAPAEGGSARRAWRAGKSSERLWKWFGVSSYEELVKIGDTFNAVPYYLGKSDGKGDLVPKDKNQIKKIRHRALRKLRRGKYKKVIVIGKFAEKIVSGYLRKKMILTLYIPHPSGVNVSANGEDGTIKKMIQLFVKIGAEE